MQEDLKLYHPFLLFLFETHNLTIILQVILLWVSTKLDQWTSVA